MGIWVPMEPSSLVEYQRKCCIYSVQAVFQSTLENTTAKSL